MERCNTIHRTRGKPLITLQWELTGGSFEAKGGPSRGPEKIMPFKPKPIINIKKTAAQEAEEKCDVISHSRRNRPKVKEGECPRYKHRSLASGQLHRNKDAWKSLRMLGKTSHATVGSSIKGFDGIFLYHSYQ